jgi:hypothetical protein
MVQMAYSISEAKVAFPFMNWEQFRKTAIEDLEDKMKQRADENR